MESLTQSERDLLYEVRDMARFRQTLFVDVAADYLTLQQQAQLIRNQLDNIKRLEEQIKIGQANDQSRPLVVYADLRELPPNFVIPQALVGKLAYKNRLLWRDSNITEEEKELLLGISDDNRYQAAARELIGWRDQKTSSLGVQQLITQLNTAQNGLATQKNQLDSQLDAFKIRLGLPPDVQIGIDNSFLSRFELIDSDLLKLVDDLDTFQEQEGPKLLPDDDAAVSVATLRRYVTRLAEIRDQVRQKAIDDVQADFAPIREILAQTSDENLTNSNGRSFRSVTERQRVIKAISADMDLFRLNQRDFEKWSRGIDMLTELIYRPDAAQLTPMFDQNQDMKVSESELPEGWRDLPPGATVAETDEMDDEQLLLQLRKGVLALRERLKQVVQGQQVVQAGLRVEMVELNDFSLDGRTDVPSINEVVNLGIQYRHDLMNTRAQVVDSRRQVEIAANDLKATLDLNVSGDLVEEGGPNDDLTVGVDFKTPIDQVTERNAYSISLINYQRAKRAYLAEEDLIKQQIRNSWRQLRVSAEQLEIDRQTVRNAALQYDNIATSPDQSDNLSLLNALSTLLNAQNSLVNDWITYETNRLNIFRDMGIMNIDQNGLWQDRFYQEDEGEQPAEDQPATILEVVPLDFDNSVPPDNETQP